MSLQGDYMVITDFSISGPLTYSDLPDDEAMKWASTMDVHSVPSFKEKLTYAGYNDVDVHYILCGKDKIIAPEHQQAMIGLVEQSSGQAPTVHKLESDHCPVVTHQEELASIVKTVLSSKA